MIYKKLPLFFGFCLLSLNLLSQGVFNDSIKITLQQADSLFISKNLLLLAEKCNVEASKAQIIQARLFNNPSIVVNQNILNTEYKTNGGKKWFDTSDKGETSVQMEQLFLLAGKRNKQIKIAELTANRQEQNYFDLLRTLKYSLRSCFYSVYYLTQILNVYDKEIVSLDKLTNAFQNQFEKGNVSKKELLRLKAMLFSLKNEKLDYSSQLISNMSDLNVLLHTFNVYYLVQPDISKIEKLSLDNIQLQSTLNLAFENRFDLKMAESDLSINQLNYSYQKSLAIPDVTLSAGWDRNGSFVHNYNFLGIQFDLPFFNRNQGNIKSAKLNFESSKYKLQNTEDIVRNDVISAYANAFENNRLYRQFDKGFIADLDELNKEMLKNYENKNLSLIEFLDYYNAYKENAIQLNNLQLNRISAFENLNFSVGKDINNK